MAISRYFPRRKKVQLSPGASKRAADFLGRELLECRLGLLAYELESKGRGRFVSGHYPINEQLINESGDRWDFVTVLRHPVERYISQYFFNLNADGPFRVSLPLDEFVSTNRGISWGRQYVHQLACRPGRPAQSDEAVDIEVACRTLDRFLIVGCLERLDKFALAFKDRFKVQLKIPRKNTGRVLTKDKDKVVTPELRRRIENICEPDLGIYRYAKKLINN